jgi:thiosulfate/3-mercaptopyruvate sulfurtransferase
MSGFARPEFLATTEWLADQVGKSDVRIVDARWRPDGTGRQAYLAGHLPGAVHLDWQTDLCEADESGTAPLLAGPAQVAAALGRIGVGDGASVVVYDDLSSLYASRVWWSLRSYGLDSVRILDGGFPAWVGEHHPISSADLAPAAATFTPRGQPRLRLTTQDVRGLLGSPDVTLVDARAPAEYRGQEGHARRLGHIPGAINVPVGATTEPGSQRLRNGDALRSLLNHANLVRGRRIVCYDGSGVSAAKLAFVLAVMGHDEVAVYDGGWAEWGDRLDLPVDR